MIKTSKGLDIPIIGSPTQQISSGKNIRTVALLGSDYVGMKPTMLVHEGDKVAKGQPLFEDKKTPGVVFTSPVSGTVREINRGERRVFQSLVIEIQDGSKVNFKNFQKKAIGAYSTEEARNLLIESGAWTYLRTRPFSRTPAVDAKPASIFINVMDTNPLAANPEVVIADKLDDFKAGVEAITRLCGKVFVVTAPNSKVDVKGIQGVKHETFSGPHPAGNVGTHIHFLDPVSASKTVWHLNYQDAIAIGHLFKTGELSNEKIISLAGPEAKNPRLIRTIQGAKLSELVNDETKGGDIRVVSGSVLGGRTAKGAEDYLGHFHTQVTLLKEGHHREFLGWQSPGVNKYSLTRVFLAKLLPGKKFAMDTSTNGSLRAIVPIGSYEKVMPLDILPTPLLKYLLAERTDQAVNLGALELDEEDLALCTFVDPCKNEFGPVLRKNLETIEKEGA